MVKATGIVRKVDALGRIVLPLDARKLCGIEEKDSLEIFVDEDDGQILLQKTLEMCIKCHTTENLKEIKSGISICDSCIAQLQ